MCSFLTVVIAALGVCQQSEDKGLVRCDGVVMGAADCSEILVHI